MINKKPGYVYILTCSTFGRLHTCKNSSFREDWVKIGRSYNYKFWYHQSYWTWQYDICTAG